MSLPDSFFISPSVHERKVKLADGKEHVLHLRELPWAEWHKAAALETSADEDERAAAACSLIAASLCEADGKPALTLKQALQLKPAVVAALVSEIRAVNGRDISPGK